MFVWVCQQVYVCVYESMLCYAYLSAIMRTLSVCMYDDTQICVYLWDYGYIHRHLYMLHTFEHGNTHTLAVTNMYTPALIVHTDAFANTHICTPTDMHPHTSAEIHIHASAHRTQRCMTWCRRVTHRNTLTHCNTVHTAHFNTLQHTAAYCSYTIQFLMTYIIT